MRDRVSKPAQELLATICLSSIVSLLMLATRMLSSQSLRYSYLPWNLLLAWVPLGLAWWLHNHLREFRFSSWSSIALFFLWLGFLPNSFYIISDFVHLTASGEVSVLYDAVMIASFSFNGLILGIMSVYLMHTELLKRMKANYAHTLIVVILLSCSFAIYLGRYLRWNTWDILVRPAGLLFDVSERFINPGAHPTAFATTSVFFLLIGSMYLFTWRLVQFLKAAK